MATNLDSSTVAANQTITATERNNLRKDLIKNAGDYETAGGTANAITLAIDAQYVAYAAGDVVKFEVASENTGSVTININGIGAVGLLKANGLSLNPGDLKVDMQIIALYSGSYFQVVSQTGNYNDNGISATAGENVDGSSTPQAVHISDGTNGLTAGRYYKSDSDNTTDARVKFDGFVKNNVTTGNKDFLITEGIVEGFTGLTQGRMYYVDTTAGAITLTNTGVPVGVAISATEIQIKHCLKIKRVTEQDSGVQSASNTTLTFSCGFRPRKVVLVGALTAQSGAAANIRILSFNVEFDGSAINGIAIKTGAPAYVTNYAAPHTSASPHQIIDLTAMSVLDGGSGSTVTLDTITITATGVTVKITEAGGGAGLAYVGAICYE